MSPTPLPVRRAGSFCSAPDTFRPWSQEATKTKAVISPALLLHSWAALDSVKPSSDDRQNSEPVWKAAGTQAVNPRAVSTVGLGGAGARERQG